MPSEKMKDLVKAINTVKIFKMTATAIVPHKSYMDDAGYDICADEDVDIESFTWKAVSTGLKMHIPYGYEGEVRSRSGLASKSGLIVLNEPGTIDSGYHGEIKVILMNFGKGKAEIRKGMRIAQICFKQVPTLYMEEVKSEGDLGKSERGTGGFGSTG
jgi:dUTP pyrophosphatase